MRLFYLFILLLILPLYSVSQVNLVPNPSFEDTVYCPQFLDQIDACSEWMNFGNSPDYYNSCNNNGLNVPNATFGFQFAHSGSGMTGLLTWLQPSIGGANYREFIAAKLLTPLIIGNKYYFSFYANFSNYPNGAVASNNLGADFSVAVYSASSPPQLTNTAKLFFNSIMTDSINWLKLSGSFIADSTYEYIIIGNFFDDMSTDTLALWTTSTYAYYYIDDVCVSTDSLYAETWTGLSSPSLISEVQMFPNPASDIINIKSSNQIDNILLLNLSGQSLLVQKGFSNNLMLDISQFSSGIYLMKISFKDGTTNFSKIVKQ